VGMQITIILISWRGGGGTGLLPSPQLWHRDAVYACVSREVPRPGPRLGTNVHSPRELPRWAHGQASHAGSTDRPSKALK
jgi:hypothetical protein